MASRMFRTRVQRTSSGPLYIAWGRNWGSIQYHSPLDVVYFVWPSGGPARAVCATLAAATYEAAWARGREGVPHISIVRSDGVEVREDCDACGSQEEAIRVPSNPENPEYLCKDCWETQLLGCDKALPWPQKMAQTGRPVGSTPYPEDIFRQDYRAAYLKLREKGVAHPSQQKVAEQLLISKRTLERKIQQYNLPWPPRD